MKLKIKKKVFAKVIDAIAKHISCVVRSNHSDTQNIIQTEVKTLRDDLELLRQELVNSTETSTQEAEAIKNRANAIQDIIEEDALQTPDPGSDIVFKVKRKDKDGYGGVIGNRRRKVVARTKE